jgi:hypothetical protein
MCVFYIIYRIYIVHRVLSIEIFFFFFLERNFGRIKRGMNLSEKKRGGGGGEGG